MERKCNKCGEVKDLETGFYKTGRKNDTNPDNRHYTCKECTKKRVSKNYHADPLKQKERDLMKKYGITLAQYNEMLELQGGKCALCPATEPGGKHNNSHWFVDHDHVTGKVRELLCCNCNLVLGLIKDSPEHLGRMIAYILKHAHEQANSGATT